MAVVQAGSYSSDLTCSLGTSIGPGCGPKKTKKKKDKKINLLVNRSLKAIISRKICTSKKTDVFLTYYRVSILSSR